MNERRQAMIAKAVERDRKRAERKTLAKRPVGQAKAEARDSLPEELRKMFDALVADYQFASEMRARHPFYSPEILADLIRAGWRRMP